jgi:hypothetical protein
MGSVGDSVRYVHLPLSTPIERTVRTAVYSPASDAVSRLTPSLPVM